MLYVLYTSTPWTEVPYKQLGLPSGETCRRRMEEWRRRGLLEQVIAVLQQRLADAGKLDWSRVIIDAATVDAKKGAAKPLVPIAVSPAAATTSP
jgi:transposase